MKAILLVAAAGMAAAQICVAATPEERGEYLVQGPMGCGNCHTPMGPEGPMAGMDLAGTLIVDEAGMKAYAANITPGARVAQWSDAELAKAIREGIRPDGSVIGPPMPIGLYRNISDNDLAAIVAYLRTVAAVDNEVPPSVYPFPLPPSYGPPVEAVADIPPGDTVEYGQYIAQIAHCMECHTPMGPQGPLMETDMGRGGFEFHGPWGTSVSANITSSPDGLANYSDEQLATMITQGVRPDGSKMLPPMPYPYLARMTPQDLSALTVYLRSVPPLPDKK
ncbi:MAG: cytochrome C [Mangrovicoccus sp.]|nr:cytochrome C [Mangrovicoccus sp.]